MERQRRNKKPQQLENVTALHSLIALIAGTTKESLNIVLTYLATHGHLLPAKGSETARLEDKNSIKCKPDSKGPQVRQRDAWKTSRIH